MRISHFKREISGHFPPQNLSCKIGIQLKDQRGCYYPQHEGAAIVRTSPFETSDAEVGTPSPARTGHHHWYEWFGEGVGAKGL